jgi:hypothetical protein
MKDSPSLSECARWDRLFERADGRAFKNSERYRQAVIEIRVARFVWAHRTVAAGLAALWNAASIPINQVIAPFEVARRVSVVAGLVGAALFAVLFVISFVHDRRKAKRAATGDVTAVR